MNLSSIASSVPVTYQPMPPAVRAQEATEAARPDSDAPVDVFEKQPADDAGENTYAAPSPVTGKPVSDGRETETTGEETDTAPSDPQKDTQKTEDKKEAELTEEELKQIEELKARDREVKAHEQAHVAAGGRYVRSGAQFEYQTGPDGERYAVGGEVSIDVSKEPGDPRATIAKMQTVIRAALAPAEPSAQDRAVAAKAAQIEMEARGDVTAESRAETMNEAPSPFTDKTDAADKAGEPTAETTETTESRQKAQAYPTAMDTSTDRSGINVYA
ncbi:putative metalloprotease CJM1_0395 family protein [Desulfatiferula olefinivorans]